MNCKEGDLAVIIYSGPSWPELIGRIVVVGAPCAVYPGNWDTVPPLVIRGRWGSVADSSLRPIRDQPGNESFVTEARKTLPRAKPVTGPVTINARGEPA